MIHTRIAQIISPTRFVLAAGAEQGVQEGMEFIIYELSDPVIDPETKESLGRLELHKGRVQVIHVQDKLSMARTLPRRLYRPGLSEILPSLLPTTEGRWIEEYEQLPIDETAATAVKADLTVKIGDLIRSAS
jgi:hypothetical protein